MGHTELRHSQSQLLTVVPRADCSHNLSQKKNEYTICHFISRNLGERGAKRNAKYAGINGGNYP